MKCSEVMTKNVQVIETDKSVQEAAKIMRESNIGALPVSSGDRLIGMVTDRDLAVNILAGGKSFDTKVGDCVGGKILYCYDDESTQEIFNQMSTLNVHRMPVMNRSKRLVGIVSQTDILAKEKTHPEASREQPGAAL